MRALVVDDSKPIRSIVSRTLRELRFECAEAANGVEALEAIASSGRPHGQARDPEPPPGRWASRSFSALWSPRASNMSRTTPG